MLNDIRFGIRTLLKTPGFTLVAVLTLALGIGSNSAIFTVINAVLLSPLPYREPARLAMIFEAWPNERFNNVSPANFLDWRKQNRTFEQMAAISETGYVLTASAARPGDAERLQGAAVSWDLFNLLGVNPLRGRGFLPEDDRPDAGRVVILSHGLWQRDFAGDPGVLGTTVTLEGASYTVVGIMPAAFQYPNKLIDVWTPIEREIDVKNMHWRGSHYLKVVGRLKPGVTLEQASADMNAIARQIKAAAPNDFIAGASTVQPLEEYVVGNVRRILVVLLAAVGFVLLISCANVANLMLSRAAVRSREIAIRTAIGAGRARIIRQLLTESVILAVAGGALGLLIAGWGTDALVGLVPDAIPRANEIHVDLGVLAFTFLVSVATGILFGLAPSVAASKADVNETLKEGGRSSSAGSPRSRLRSALVVCEIALSLMLMIGAGLLIASFARLTGVDSGFKPDNVLTVRLALPEPKYLDDTVMNTFYRGIIGRLQAIPGVESASAISDLPLTGHAFDNTFRIVGRPLAPGEFISAQMRWVSPDYFRTLGIPLVRGRAFTGRDSEKSPRVLVINQAMARRFWPGDQAVGKRIVVDFRNSPDFEIVGIAGDVRSGLELEQEPYMYVAYPQLPRASMYIALRARGALNSAALAASVRAEVSALDNDVAVYRIRTMNEVMAISVASRRFNMLLLGIFAALALVLAAVGIYGVMAYAVTQRTHEIGVRVALGAQRRDVMRMLMGHGLVLALVGVAVGLAGAFALTRLMASLLFGVSSTDVTTFAVVSALLTAVTLLASFVPALRATRIDPITALRYE